jgi:hypothetical protein
MSQFASCIRRKAAIVAGTEAFVSSHLVKFLQSKA